MSFGRFLTWVALIAALAALGSVAAGFYRLEREQTERRNQTCTLNEGDHLQDVTELRRTYKRLPQALEFYLETAPERLRPFLRNAIASDLVRLEKEARIDAAPQFCDEPGIGLPEPDPVIPKRPKGLPL